MKRKVTAVLLSAALVTGLAGCGPSADQGDSSVVQLTLQTHYSLQQEQELKKYIDKWNKNHPNIQVKHKFVDFAQLLPTIMAKQTTGQQADILHVYSLWGGQLAKGNVLAEPTAEVKKDIEASYPAAAVNGATVNGKLLGYPTEVQTYGLYYNKKLLQEEGYSAPPKTWDELYQMAKKITKRDTSGKVLVEGYGPPMGESFQETAVVHPYLSLLYAARASLSAKMEKKQNLTHRLP
nr:ABC transporter substrate-binding protein [Paenactinomyces guangxiensis]